MRGGRFGGRVGKTMQTPVRATNARSIYRERVQASVAKVSTLQLIQGSTRAFRQASCVAVG